tara:strand:- start:2125 stop:3279 length:1155 start_codon:yes stop_codon:yes gene_type:complete
MKNLLIGIILFFLFSCSSNPQNTIARDQEELLIEKPKINYKLNSLPKDINVIYFSNSNIQTAFPEEVKGLLTNYYSFSKKNKYFPNIKFINLNVISSCSFVLNSDAYNFIFFLKESIDNKPYDLCLNRFTNKNVLVVSDFDDNSTLKKFRRFLVNRNEDKYELIRFMDSYSNFAMIIDNEVTNDKYEIGDFWKKEFKKEVAEYRTFNEGDYSQDIFTNLLLLEQSFKRKRKLSRLISKELSHKSRARQDIDALFLSVSTREARNLKPALDYSYNEEMEVFLANDWVGDFQFLKADKDLDGVISIEIPFMLPTPIPIELRALQNKSRNFAIGYDAFEIVLLTKGARDLSKVTYKGLTGKITFRNNDIDRKSKIFKVRNGTYEYLN